MIVLRKFLAFVLSLAAICLLAGVIFAVGTSRIALTTTYISDFSRKIIKEIPSLIDKTYTVSQKKDSGVSGESRIWLDAMAKVKTTPSQLLKTIGVYKWLDTELDGAFKKIGKAITGDGKAERIVVDTGLLNKAFASQEFRNYVTQVIGLLPACDAAGNNRWNGLVVAGKKHSQLPACNPGDTGVTIALERVTSAVSQFPGKKVVLQKDDVVHLFTLAKFGGVALWLLFIPALLLILMVAGIGGTSGGGFMR